MNQNLSVSKIGNNCFYDCNSNYFMGIDAYDGRTFAICVMKKNENGIEVCYSGRTTDKDAFENEVKMIAAFYHISESQILKEKP